MSFTPDLILVDDSSYLYRAFHALPPLIGPHGKPTGATYGVINMLRKLQQSYKTSHVAVVFDPKGKTFRSDIYAEYKSHRPPMPDDLRVQIEPLHNIIRGMGLPLIIENGVEADDVIGTLATRAAKAGKKVLISTGDKDMAQLVNENVILINTMNNHIMDKNGVKEKFGVPPELIIDYLALIGDKSDNVPGVDKCGPKTAVKWLTEYKNLDGVIKNVDSIGGKVGDNLRCHLKFLPTGVELVTIVCDLKLEESLRDCDAKAANKEQLRKMFTEMGFKSWLKQLDSTPSESPEQSDGATNNENNSKTNNSNIKPANKYITIQDDSTWQQWKSKLEKASVFAIDTETTSLDAMQAKLVGVSFSTKSGEAAYLPLQHQTDLVPQQLALETCLNDLKQILSDENKTIVGQNLKYDLKVLACHGVDVKAQCWDTMLAAYVLQPNSNRHDLDTLAQTILDITPVSFTDIAGKGKKQLTFDQIPLEQAAPYAAEDADLTWQLYEHFKDELKNNKSAKKVFTEIETPLLPILTSMEINGVLIDSEALKDYSLRLAKRISTLQHKIHELAKEEFNISSPKQLREILYEKLKYKCPKKTPTGQPSTAEDVLQQLALNYPLPKLILEYRSLNKLKSTYTDRLPEQVDPKTGRVHPMYRQNGTATGRLSCKDPNLQNIPVRTEAGREIRQAFIAGRGRRLLSADYSQIELRLMAQISGEPQLRDAFARQHDVHRATAAEVFDTPYDKVSDDQRRSAKAINFGLLYGMSAFGLAKQLGTDRKSAQEYIDTYFKRYPKIAEYMEKIREEAQKNGFVKTIFGRELPVPDIKAKNPMVRKAAERAAINAPLQGSAADLIKYAMIDVNAALTHKKLDALMIMQVHDELVFDVAEKDVDELSKIVQRCMVKAADNRAKLDVELEVTVGVGKNWDEAH